MTVEDEVIRAGMRALALRRWDKATPEQRLEVGRKLAASRKRKRLLRAKKAKP